MAKYVNTRSLADYDRAAPRNSEHVLDDNSNGAGTRTDCPVRSDHASPPERSAMSLDLVAGMLLHDGDVLAGEGSLDRCVKRLLLRGVAARVRRGQSGERG